MKLDLLIKIFRILCDLVKSVSINIKTFRLVWILKLYIGNEFDQYVLGIFIKHNFGGGQQERFLSNRLNKHICTRVCI